MRRLRADLHIHTALSPCGADEMTPPAIIEAALAAGLEMIAVCDHNSAGNAKAMQAAAEGAVSVLAGIEITTVEEAHVVGLFPDAARAMAVGRAVRVALPLSASKAAVWGEQTLMDAVGRVTGHEARLLGAATSLSLADAVALIRRHDGLAIASHVDRPSFSVPSQLGVFPDDVRFDAIEISAAGWRQGRQDRFAALGLPMVCSSDSHWLTEIGGGFTWVEARAVGFDELVCALRGVDGRRLADA